MLEKLVGAWRRIHPLFKAWEKKVDAARTAVVQRLVDAGVLEVTTKHGTIKLQTAERTDWEALARSVIKPEFIEQSKALFTKESAPFIRALPSWGTK